MLTHEQIALIGTYSLHIVDLKSFHVFEETPILGCQQRMELTLNEDFCGYKVRMFGAKDGEIIEKKGDARWVDGKLTFYFSETKNCQFSIKSLAVTVVKAESAFRGFVMVFELDKVLYCIRCER